MNFVVKVYRYVGVLQNEEIWVYVGGYFDNIDEVGGDGPAHALFRSRAGSMQYLS